MQWLTQVTIQNDRCYGRMHVLVCSINITNFASQLLTLTHVRYHFGDRSRNSIGVDPLWILTGPKTPHLSQRSKTV